jgi:hypothetical protein
MAIEAGWKNVYWFRGGFSDGKRRGCRSWPGKSERLVSHVKSPVLPRHCRAFAWCGAAKQCHFGEYLREFVP